MASTYWNCNESLARSLAAQRAEYVVGALLLVLSFGLQIVVILTKPTNFQSHPPTSLYDFCFFAVTILIVSVLAWLSVYFLKTTTVKKVISELKKDV